jgi:hypothetical protein
MNEYALIFSGGAVIASLLLLLVTARLTREQIAASMDIASKQMAASANIASKQIEASTDLARKQITATLVSANRQNWINVLRDSIAGFLAAHSEYSRHFETGSFNQVASAEKAWFLSAKIGLMLNPLEEDHDKLITLLECAFGELGKHKGDDMNVRIKLVLNQREEIIRLSQRILKSEWERVKKGE